MKDLFKLVLMKLKYSLKLFNENVYLIFQINHILLTVEGKRGFQYPKTISIFDNADIKMKLYIF